ncbi:MAG: MATE family efflux transporter [Clostridiales Family XIII bacterium]|jgi:putative MATE family efflux protein|nr:MATE family efflux transporter [Clostridiales Family XIII bacterium]
MKTLTDRITPDDKALYRKVFRVALPIAAQSLISTSLSLVDNLLVVNIGKGHIAETALSAIGLSTQIYIVFWMVLFGFTGGTITYMAQFFGKGDMANLRRVSGISITVCFLVGIAFFLACFLFPDKILSIFTNLPEVMQLGTPVVKYGSFVFLTWSITVPLTAALKSTQQTSIPMKISLVALSFSTFLTLILIYGFLGMPKLGVMGVAVGIVISRALELALYIIVIFARKNVLAAPLREFFSWDRGLFLRVINNALPTTANETMWGLGMAMYNAAFGRVSDTVFAACQAGYTIMNIFAVACFSIGETMLILVGERLGADDLAGAKRAASKILVIVAIVGLCAGGLLFLISPLIASLFPLTSLGTFYALRILGVYSGFLVMKALSGAFIVGVLRAGGDTRFAMITEICTVWLYGVPCAFIFSLYVPLPIHFVILILQFEEVIKFLILLRRYKSGKWVRDLVKDID